MREYFVNPYYRGEKFVTDNGQEKCKVYIRSQRKWVEVSAEVYKLLCTEIDREEKSTERYYEDLVCLDQTYHRGNGEEVSALNIFEGSSPELIARSAEEVFLEADLISQIRSFIGSNYGLEMLELFEAVFVRRVSVEDYAQQIGKPASTVRSRKAKLIRELKKNKNFF